MFGYVRYDRCAKLPALAATGFWHRSIAQSEIARAEMVPVASRIDDV